MVYHGAFQNIRLYILKINDGKWASCYMMQYVNLII